MTEDQIKHMVNRFLGWILPEDFNPDGGVSFKRLENRHHHPDASPFYPMPSGTNLLDATQADAMVRYMIEGLPPVNIGKKWQWLSSNGWVEIHNPSFERVTELLDSGYALRRAVP